MIGPASPRQWVGWHRGEVEMGTVWHMDTRAGMIKGIQRVPATIVQDESVHYSGAATKFGHGCALILAAGVS